MNRTPHGDERDELYVGYLPAAPVGVARFVRRLVPGLLAGALLIAGSLVLAQARFDSASFELGRRRFFTGHLSEHPYPLLRGGSDGAEPSTYLLAAPGKHGARELVTGLDEAEVRFQGTLISRGAARMVQIVPGSVAPLDASMREDFPTEAGEELGVHTLIGEIVDGKCFLGVMKPGRGKVHRSCAARCISGGLPPLLWVASESGEELELVLVGERGEALGKEVLPWVGRAVEVTGRVVRRADLLYLYASPVSYALPAGAAARSNAG